MLVPASFPSRSDYCNSLLAGLSSSTGAVPQRIQNVTVRLVFDWRANDHLMAALCQLHRLQAEFRISYKLCLLMHQVNIGQRPQHIADMLTSATRD
jgi:hypothetical protein